MLPHIATHSNTRAKDTQTERSSTLQHTATHCNTLQRTALHCNALQRASMGAHGNICVVLHMWIWCSYVCIQRPHIEIYTHTLVVSHGPARWVTRIDVTHCNIVQRTATHCNTLQYTATHCNTLQHTATHCNTLQHTATHCNTLQHTATHMDQRAGSHIWMSRYERLMIISRIAVREWSVGVLQRATSCHPREWGMSHMYVWLMIVTWLPRATDTHSNESYRINVRIATNRHNLIVHNKNNPLIVCNKKNRTLFQILEVLSLHTLDKTRSPQIQGIYMYFSTCIYTCTLKICIFKNRCAQLYKYLLYKYLLFIDKYVYIYVYIYVYMYVYTCIYIYTYMYNICIYAYIYIT